MSRRQGSSSSTPSTRAYNALLMARQRRGEHTRVRDLFDEMKVTPGCLPDVASCNCVMAGLAEEGDYRAAEQLLTEMKQASPTGCSFVSRVPFSVISKLRTLSFDPVGHFAMRVCTDAFSPTEPGHVYIRHFGL